jgi:DNA-binding FrmR family transcriptional regulator
MDHTHEHEYEYSHAQEHSHPHEEPDELELSLEETAHHHHFSHHHSPEEKKRQLNRLSRVIGHLQHVKRMIEEDQDCADVLMQLSASRSALTGLGKEIINEHITHCITHAVQDGDMEAIEEFQKAIEKFC